MSFLRKTNFIAVLCLLAWNSNVYAQAKALKIERTMFGNFGLQSANPSFLQTLQDSVLLNVKANYSYGKGDFKNYFSPDSYYQSGIETESYNRLNQKTVVYGFASYNYSKGKNFSGTSFLDPYKIPFNFTSKTEDTKGDRREEQYHLAGAISYHLAKQLILGGKIDYKTINFAKLKDMRNVSEILDLTLNIGLAYRFPGNSTLGVSYNYNRYIENMSIDRYGTTEKDYYALINRGSFMGLFYLHGGDGILDGNKKPWVDLTHATGLQYNISFSEKSDYYIELNYENGNGHFGNKSDASVVYMKHKKEAYSLKSKLSVKGYNRAHIVSVMGRYDNVTNNEQLFREVTTSGGDIITEYYGENEVSDKKHSIAGVEYDYLWGNSYLKAPWQITANYTYNNIKRNSSYYPYYRKQNITWHAINLGIAKTIHHKKYDYLIKYSSGFVSGSGGEPIDGLYTSNTGSTVPPDYLNNLLYKEKEYLTTERLISTVTFRVEHEYKQDIGIYIELNAAYTKPFKTEYLKGNFLDLSLTAGLAF